MLYVLHHGQSERERHESIKIVNEAVSSDCPRQATWERAPISSLFSSTPPPPSPPVELNPLLSHPSTLLYDSVTALACGLCFRAMCLETRAIVTAWVLSQAMIV